jgi:hypothetical protein
VKVFSEVTDLVRVVIWPCAITVILIVYREQISKLASAVGRRVTGVTLAGFTVAFEAASEPSAEVWSALQSFADPQAPTSVSDSSNALLSLINTAQKAESARFDLRTGHSWLTSRLFIFAILLPEILDVRCMVFTETRDGIARRFVGLAEPRAVAAALARRFDWLPRAWTRASISLYGCDLSAVTQLRVLARDDGVQDWQLTPKLIEIAQESMIPQDLLLPGVAESVAQQYLNDSEILRNRPKNSPSDPGWVQLREIADGNVQEEHARWIGSGAELDNLLGDALTRPHVIETSGASIRQLNRHAVLKSGQFVAVVDGDGRFLRLLHREVIVDELAREAAMREADEP